MCGRFTLTVSASVLADLFQLGAPPCTVPRFNIAPTQTHPIVLRSGNGEERRWLAARWGLVPHWAKDLSIGARLINARSETALTKPSFRQAVKSRRCLVPADGFFEWKATSSGKQPFHIRYRDRRAFAFAGLWESWQSPETEVVHSFTILTGEPNEVASTIHRRMPCILDPCVWHEWLSATILPAARFADLTSPVSGADMEAVAVNRRVNSPAHDDPTCLEPVPQGDSPGRLPDS